MKSDLFDKFLRYYEIPFNKDPAILEESENSLNNILNSFIILNTQEMKNEIDHFRTRLSEFRNSFSCFDVMLFECFESLQNYNPENIQKFRTIEPYLEYFEPDEKALICFCRGLFIKHNPEFTDCFHEECNRWLQKALILSDGKRIADLPAIIKYNQAYSVGMTAGFYQGIRLLEEARFLFQRTCNLNRITGCLNNESILLLYSGFYEAAIERLKGILSHSETVHFAAASQAASDNLVLAYILHSDYDLALDLIEKCNTESKLLSNRFLAPYCLYRLSKPKEALRKIANSDRNSMENEDVFLFKLIRAVIRKDRRAIRNVVHPFLTRLSSQYNWGILFIFLQILCTYFEEEADFKNLSVVQKALLNARDHIFPKELDLDFS